MAGLVAVLYGMGAYALFLASLLYAVGFGRKLVDRASVQASSERSPL